MSYQPAGTLKNRTFIGLMIAQFLAGFNDQAIHAAAMFYSIHRGVLSEGKAITLMPLLFYIPWALFVTVSAYFADRYSKTATIVVWKMSEIAISLVLILGFVIGTGFDNDAGVWIVLSCVFLMGTHAAFFSPAKYGAMPEVLQPHVLSKGNGVLESTTFLSNILGTVAGGLMTVYLFEREWWIGIILLVLSIIGAGASLMMVRLPASNPTKVFNLITPLTNGFRSVFGSRPLTLSVLGIAFFLFMVAYMRSVLYMHGQTRVPPWADDYTSLIVATVMLGIGIGCPLAGYFSGGKIELGLVPIGCLGMMAAALVAGMLLEHQIALIAALIGIGFFSGFYMVPLYSLLQFRAPKKSKGEIVAVSNFFNVIGTTAASLLFGVLVYSSQMSGVTPLVQQNDLVRGTVKEEVENEFHHIEALTIDVTGRLEDGQWREVVPPSPRVFRAERTDVLLTVPKEGLKPGEDLIVTEYITPGGQHMVIRRAEQPMTPVQFKGKEVEQREIARGKALEFAQDEHRRITSVTLMPDDGKPVTVDAHRRYVLLKLPGQGVEEGEAVVVSRYKINDVVYYTVRKSADAMVPAFNNEILPRYLFFGAAGMTLLILIMLCRKLPDIFLRTRVWRQSLGKAQIRSIHLDKLPTFGPVVLVTNCDSPTAALQLLSATDRNTIVLLPGPRDVKGGHIVQIAPTTDWTTVEAKALATLKNGDLLAISLAGTSDPGIRVGVAPSGSSLTLLGRLGHAIEAPIIPVWWGVLSERRVRVVFGNPVSPDADLLAAINGLKSQIEDIDGPASTYVKAADKH